MKVVLPSNGVLGIKTVDMRPPTFQDLRSVSTLNQEEELLKYQFTLSLLKDSPDMSKITKMDMDYLYIIAAMQVQLNQVGYSFTCKCGQENKGKFVFGEQEVVELPKIKLPHKKMLRGKQVEYNILSAAQHLEACEYALQQEDFKTAYDNAVAAFTFGKTLDNIEEIKQYDISLFLSAFLFQRVMYHGVQLEAKHKCEKCGKENSIYIEPTSELVKMSMDMMLDQFSSVLTLVDFDTFLDFTVPEFQMFRDKITSKLNDIS